MTTNRSLLKRSNLNYQANAVCIINNKQEKKKNDI